MSNKLNHLRNTLLIVLMGVLLAGCFGLGQWKISGVVKDADGNPLPGVAITVVGKKTSTVVTDEEGIWTVSVSGDEVTITAVREGYAFEAVEVEKAKNLEPIEIIAVPELTISPASGYYQEIVKVSLAIAGNYTIYYTLDGSEPTADSEKYTEPFEIAEATTVKAIAINNAVENDVKGVVSAEYEVSLFGMVINGGAELGKEPWENQACELLVTDEEFYSGSHSFWVTNRTGTGPGAIQVIQDWEPGKTYRVSAMFKYNDGPDEKQFNIAIFNKNWAQIGGGINSHAELVAFGTIPKGEWTKISGEFTLPAGVENTENLSIIFETPWVPEINPELDLMDFYLDDVALFVVD